MSVAQWYDWYSYKWDRNVLSWTPSPLSSVEQPTDCVCVWEWRYEACYVSIWERGIERERERGRGCTCALLVMESASSRITILKGGQGLPLGEWEKKHVSILVVNSCAILSSLMSAAVMNIIKLLTAVKPIIFTHISSHSTWWPWISVTTPLNPWIVPFSHKHLQNLSHEQSTLPSVMNTSVPSSGDTTD